MNPTSPSVLVFDVETAPIKAYVWGLRDQNISLSQIIDDWSIIAFGAKWLGSNAVFYADTRRKTEKQILSEIWELLDRADIVITQNGKSFDSRRLNARFIHYRMLPPSPYRHIDTYLLVKGAADFTSNKLEYLTEKLCVKYKKLKHSKFPGMSLWVECLKGNVKAWEEMKKYNIHDVLSTEELYNRVKAWGPQNMPKLFLSPATCSVCGHQAQRRGPVKGKPNLRWVWCKSGTCGKWGTEPIPKKEA